ncbi:phage distal tail protein, partial [Virgibacillus kimchii]
IQDFEISSVFDIISRREIENFRMEIYFHDENMNNLGKLGIKDNTRSFLRRRGLGRAGHYRGDGPSNGYAIGQHNHSYDNVPEATIMQLRVKREGNKFTFYIARWYTQRHVDVVTESFNDVNNEFSGRLKFITLFIGSYQDRVTPWRLRMNSVEVFELRTVTEDQTPYIAYPGDIITFDHITEEILLNGEDATPHKDFGGDYFQLQKGENQIAVLPDLSFNSELKYRPRYR